MPEVGSFAPSFQLDFVLRGLFQHIAQKNRQKNSSTSFLCAAHTRGTETRFVAALFTQHAGPFSREVVLWRLECSTKALWEHSALEMDCLPRRHGCRRQPFKVTLKQPAGKPNHYSEARAHAIGCRFGAEAHSFCLMVQPCQYHASLRCSAPCIPRSPLEFRYWNG